jgi:hypothetical protein
LKWEVGMRNKKGVGRRNKREVGRRNVECGNENVKAGNRNELIDMLKSGKFFDEG